jgi:hypothetical protein
MCQELEKVCSSLQDATGCSSNTVMHSHKMQQVPCGGLLSTRLYSQQFWLAGLLGSAVCLLNSLLSCMLPLLADDIQHTGDCPLGDVCPNAHSVFESWLHPLR